MLEALQAFLQECLDGQHLWATALAVFLGTFLVMSLKGIWDASKPIDLKAMAIQLGEVIPTELAKYDGQDPFRPILLSLRGRIYDVSPAKEMYGPGALHSAWLLWPSSCRFLLLVWRTIECWHYKRICMIT